MESTPLIIILIITLVATYLIVRLTGPSKCAAASASEGFGSLSDSYLSLSKISEGFAVPSLKSCPYGTTEYINKKSETLCCDGKVEGKKCLGKNMCRFSNAKDGTSVPHCADYLKSQMFNVKGSLIQNPDTNMCLVPIANKERSVMGQKCSATDKNQLWTYNNLGQLQHDSTKLCLTQTVDPRAPFIKYHVLAKCGLNNSQKYTYNFNTNTIESKSSPGKPLFLQDNFFDNKSKYLLTHMTDDEIKSAVKKQTGKEIRKDEMINLKKLYYSDSAKKQRRTFLSIKPTIKQSITIVQNKFKK